MSTPPESGDEEDDISPLDYARLNGLARDHFSESSPFSFLDVLRGSISDGLTDDTHLPQLPFPKVDGTHERLAVSKDGAKLIAWVAQSEPDGSIDDIVHEMLENRTIKKMRLELPLLKSDHALDCSDFARRETFEVQLKDVRLPLDSLDDEKNEGLGFSSTLWKLGVEKIEELKKEKISVARETLQRIQGCIKPDWSDTDEREVWENVQKHKRSTALDPITPPLSPLPSLPQPYEPSLSDPTFELPILSDPASLTNGDLFALESQIFNQDVPTPIRNILGDQNETTSDSRPESGVVKLANLYSPMGSVDHSIVSPITDDQYVKREHLKVEEPLTPQDPAPVAKSVHFNDFVEEMLLDPSSSPHSDLFHGTYFDEAFVDAAERATRQVEQEALLAADVTGRVEVPTMDFSFPEPPWKKLENARGPATSLSIRKAIIKDTIGTNLPTWLGQKHGDIKLKWNPFPHDLAKVIQKEDYPADDNTWQEILNAPGDDRVIGTSTLTWKPPGLRILKDDEDEDDIEPGRFHVDGDRYISFLVKKRKKELEGQTSIRPGQNLAKPIELDKETAPKSTPPKTKILPKSNGIPTAARKPPDDHTNSEDFGLLMGGSFSAINALDNFLELRGIKKQKLTGSPHLVKDHKQSKSRNEITQAEPWPKPGEQPPVLQSPVNLPNPLPVPDLHPPTAPISAIVSSTLLKHRSLIKHIESQVSGLNLIERDFTAHNSTAWLPNSVTRSPITSPLAAEADLIVSPTTGIILTTLQKIKQRPLPGQKTKPAIRDRLERVSARYENLVVFVSEGAANGLGEGDCTAFAEFVGFASGLSATVSVQFVGGGDETLFEWLAGSIVQHAGVGNSLLEEETHWELFLRRAGMNAFAAQSISAAIKAPDVANLQSPQTAGQYGLAAFVKMGRQQRLDRFGHVCGEKLLDRVSASLDAIWD